MPWMRRALVTVLASASLLAGGGVASAAVAPQQTGPIGPECRPGVVLSVLEALARNGTPVVPGQKVQYVQVTQGSDGIYRLELCTVTIPEA